MTRCRNPSHVTKLSLRASIRTGSPPWRCSCAEVRARTRLCIIFLYSTNTEEKRSQKSRLSDVVGKADVVALPMLVRSAPYCRDRFTQNNRRQATQTPCAHRRRAWKREFRSIADRQVGFNLYFLIYCQFAFVFFEKNYFKQLFDIIKYNKKKFFSKINFLFFGFQHSSYKMLFLLGASQMCR